MSKKSNDDKVTVWRRGRRQAVLRNDGILEMSLTPDAQAQLDNIEDMMTWPEIKKTPAAVARLAKLAKDLRGF